MTPYQAPQQEFLFLLREVFNYSEHAASLGFDEATLDAVEMILPEAAKFFEERLAPTNQLCDQVGAQLLEDNTVVPPSALDGVYRQMIGAGWTALSGKPAYGGEGFPALAGLLVQEIMQSANLAFSLLPLLSSGVVHALDLHADEAQKQRYLTKLVTGQWAGTMNLTEPQAGTDLGAIKTRAVPAGDHYKITGQKIFITWGDHEYADNIIHLVLARTPDAPAGTKGISMFIVPKYLVHDDGSLGERNDLKAVGLEHKLGIHASPTCTMQYGDNGGAVGYLVGAENHGLAYMFAMMNAARLAVGHQGVAAAERAYQQAVAYALERVQSPVAGNASATIIHHPDVRRMLLQMRALTEAGRALSFEAYASEDRALHDNDEASRRYYARRVEVLTPLVKAWCTESANEATSLGIQVHGGMGFIEETGAAQHYRDARILAIYEGTNGIQALDFIGRKTLRDGGEGVTELLAACMATATSMAADAGQGKTLAAALAAAVDQCQQALDYVLAKPHEAEAIAFNYLMLFANTACFWMLCRSAQAALVGDGSDFYRRKLATVNFFKSQILARNSQYLAAVLAGANDIMALSADDFGIH